MSDFVALREVTPENEAAVRALAVAPAQELFVASVSESLEEAEGTPSAHTWLRAIYAGKQAVGFVMLSYDVPPGHPDYPWRYFLWRFLIDAGHQRHGYGRAGGDGLGDRPCPAWPGRGRSLHVGPARRRLPPAFLPRTRFRTDRRVVRRRGGLPASTAVRLVLHKGGLP